MMNFPFEMAYLHILFVLVSVCRVCHLYLVVEPTHLQSIREIGSPSQGSWHCPNTANAASPRWHPSKRLILSKLRYHINHINSWLFGSMLSRSTHPSF